jgi:plastocyanin
MNFTYRTGAFMRWLTAAGLLVAAIGIVSCDIQNQTGVTGPAGISMTVVDFKGYEPDSVDIPAGTTVTFGWNGTNSRQHNFTFTDPSIASSPTQLYGNYSWTFTNPGTYRFFCTVHGAASEHGVVVVH